MATLIRALHQNHPEIVKRLKRADDHLRRIIEMIEEDHPCLDLAQHLHAVERAIGEAKACSASARSASSGS